MESLDLDIDNYSLEDILNLFNIDYNFDEAGLKRAKQTVLKSHPDKCGLDKKYFLFFTKAYKYLYFIYDFRKKKYDDTCVYNNNNNNNNNNRFKNEIIDDIEYEDILSSSEKKETIEILNNNKQIKENFNEWFNKMFEEHKITSESEREGYGNWLKDDDNFNNFQNEQCNNIDKMNESINKMKKDRYSIIEHNDFSELYSTKNNFSDLLNDKVDDYSSDVFNKFGYNDLRKAHEETLIPVSDNVKRQQFNSVGDYEIFRKQQETQGIVYSMEESKQILENNKKNNEKIDNQRAFKLAKQDEEIQKTNDKFWSKLKLLTNT
jgi:hypothetical protein